MNEETNDNGVSRQRMRKYVIVASIIAAYVGLMSIPPALMSVMVFSAPGSQDNPATNLLFWAAFTFPVACFAGAITAVGLRFLKAYRSSVVIVHLPMVNLGLAVVAIVWLEIAYGGRFAG